MENRRLGRLLERSKIKCEEIRFRAGNVRATLHYFRRMGEGLFTYFLRQKPQTEGPQKEIKNPEQTGGSVYQDASGFSRCSKKPR